MLNVLKVLAALRWATVEPHQALRDIVEGAKATAEAAAPNTRAAVAVVFIMLTLEEIALM
jgi:hypothetical protein